MASRVTGRSRAAGIWCYPLSQPFLLPFTRPPPPICRLRSGRLHLRGTRGPPHTLHPPARRRPHRLQLCQQAVDPSPAACGVGYSFATQSRERAAGLGAPALPYHHRRPACSFATHSRERATHHAADHRLAPPHPARAGSSFFE